MMIVYGSTLSPYVRKTVAFAAEKSFDFELCPTSMDPGSDFAVCSPFKKMPALRDGDFTLADSTAIITYIDALKADPELLPKDPKLRAKTIWFEEFADTVLIACQSKMFVNRIVMPRFFGRPGDLAAADKAEREELPPILDYLESVIPESGYLVDGRLTLADLAVASPFVNFAHMNVDISPSSRPKTARYVERILARPSFAKHIEQEKASLAG
ncbi:MAG TPA: glutathione S-transferase family protein [Gammaproteobacteria bacterium]|nr:glutathione S-transferase family protein [Gammaproteobacteria bacterium]